jgi:hypothetical protein
VRRGWGAFDEAERAGHAWVGETAESFAAQRLAEKEKEESTSPVERMGKARDVGKRVRMPSISISSSSGSDVLLPLTPTTSPVQQTPLTPPLSDYSTSEADPAWLKSYTPSDRKRSPSEPSERNAGLSKSRTRSMTAASNVKETVGDRNAIQTTTSRGTKHARGRGGGNSNARGTRRSVETNTESPSGRGRGGRGPRTSNSETSRAKKAAATA